MIGQGSLLHVYTLTDCHDERPTKWQERLHVADIDGRCLMFVHSEIRNNLHGLHEPFDCITRRDTRVGAAWRDLTDWGPRGPNTEVRKYIPTQSGYSASDTEVLFSLLSLLISRKCSRRQWSASRRSAIILPFHIQFNPRLYTSRTPPFLARQ